MEPGCDMSRAPRVGERFAVPGADAPKTIARVVTALVIDGQTQYLVADETGGQWTILPIEEEAIQWRREREGE